MACAGGRCSAVRQLAAGDAGQSAAAVGYAAGCAVREPSAWLSAVRYASLRSAPGAYAAIPTGRERRSPAAVQHSAAAAVPDAAASSCTSNAAEAGVLARARLDRRLDGGYRPQRVGGDAPSDGPAKRRVSHAAGDAEAPFRNVAAVASIYSSATHAELPHGCAGADLSATANGPVTSRQCRVAALGLCRLPSATCPAQCFPGRLCRPGIRI